MAALLSPLVLLVGLALAGGGYDVATRHIAGLAVWLVVVALLVLGAASGAKVAWPLFRATGLLVGLALLSGISSLWSGSAELSVLEADRVLVYLGVFLAAFLIVQTDLRRQRFAEGIAISAGLIALMALGSRLLPNVIEATQGLGSGPQLLFPLEYWNANGVMFGIAITLLLWMSRYAAATAMRWASVAVMPAAMLALYFTYSRGGLLATVIAAVALLALSRDRLWMLATLAVTVLGALPALLAVQDRRSLADNIDNSIVADQGVTVLLILIAGTILAVGLSALLGRFERKDGRLKNRAERLSRDPRTLKGIAAVAGVAVVVAAIALGGRAWEEFSQDEFQGQVAGEQQLSSFSGAGRHDLWRVAVDAFAEKPLFGNGAASYEFSWEEQRSIDTPVHNAHSLYLEAFADLGVVGGLLVLALVGSLLWTGFSAWRFAQHPQRERYAALFAAMLAFAVAAGFDWFWEIPGLGVVFFLAAAVLVAARCAQLAPPVDQNGSGDRRFGLAVASLVVAWIAAIALVGPLLVERELDASRDATAAGNVVEAVDHAERARSIEPWAASPYVQLGLLAQLQGDFPAADEHFSDAIEREDRNWQWYYLRSEVKEEAGDTTGARRDLRRARELNPRIACLREEVPC